MTISIVLSYLPRGSARDFRLAGQGTSPSASRQKPQRLRRPSLHGFHYEHRCSKLYTLYVIVTRSLVPAFKGKSLRATSILSYCRAYSLIIADEKLILKKLSFALSFQLFHKSNSHTSRYSSPSF